MRLLGFLRLWRLSRLHETLVAAERARTEEEAREARTERERALRAEVERARLEGIAAESANYEHTMRAAYLLPLRQGGLRMPQ